MVFTLVNLSDRYSGTRLLAVLNIKYFNCLERLSARLSHLRARRIWADLTSQQDPVMMRAALFSLVMLMLCTGQFQNRPSPLPGKTPGHLTFLKNFGQIARYVASLDGQMTHPFELQRGSNLPPSREKRSLTFGNKHNRLPLETSTANFQPLRISCSACLRSMP